jgi:hypothetical protein
MNILCAISHHGLGHLAQAAPVLNAIGATRPDMAWTIWSGLPRQALESRLDIPFVHRNEPADVGLLMQDAVRVDVTASALAYQAFHRDWTVRLAGEADWIRHEDFRGVISNAAYLPLAAAGQAGIPGVGFCSLNWWDIAHSYLHDEPNLAQAFAEMREAYLGARAFLRLSPGMPMAWMTNLETAAPVASLGRSRRPELGRTLGLAGSERLVLLAFGGVAYMNAMPLPTLEGVVWLAPDSWTTAERPDLVGFGQTRIPFHDLMASCDALVTKVGYGSFVEAAGLGLPVLYLDRPDWPETPWLAAWLERHTRARAMDEETLFSPAVGEALAGLWQRTVPGVPDISGAPAIGRRLLDCLGS